MGLIKKRFGPKYFMNSLGLNHEGYTVQQKPKKKQKVYLKDYDPIVGQPSKADNIELQHQQAVNKQKFYKYNADDTRVFKNFAKPMPPVAQSYDHLLEDYDRQIQHTQKVAALKKAEFYKRARRNFVHAAKLEVLKRREEIGRAHV